MKKYTSQILAIALSLALLISLAPLPMAEAGQNDAVSLTANRIAAGYYHSLFVQDDGTILSWGWDEHGQLGIGSVTEKTYAKPQTVVGPDGKGALSNVISVAAGDYHSLALDKDGKVWAWGNNGGGRLGIDPSTTASGVPVQVTGLTNVVAIEAGSFHSLALDRDGHVWAWGANWSGQLGDNTYDSSFTPVQVVGPDGNDDLEDIVAISAGGYHSLALDVYGYVWAWGENTRGQLGIGSVPSSSTPVQVEIKNEKGDSQQIISIAAGENFSLALDRDGHVWAWGENSDGQLGKETDDTYSYPVKVENLPKIKSIAAGINHSLAVAEDGTVYAWGNNRYGQLGYGVLEACVSIDSCTKFTNIKDLMNYVDKIKDDGVGLQIKIIPETSPTPVKVGSIPSQMQVQSVGNNGGLTNVVSIATGYQHSLALQSNGNLLAWGSNKNGQLGNEKYYDFVLHSLLSELIIPFPISLYDEPNPAPPSGGGRSGNDDTVPPPRCRQAVTAKLQDDDTIWRSLFPAFLQVQQNDGSLALRASVDSEQVLALLAESAPDGGKPVTVVVDATSAVAETETVSSVCVNAPLGLWEQMQQHADSVLEVKTTLGIIRIPSQAVDASKLIDGLSRRTGRAVTEGDTTIQICIQLPNDHSIRQAQPLIQRQNMTPLAGPVLFTVDAVAEGARMPLETDTYISHLIAIGAVECPEDIDLDFSRIVGIRYDQRLGQLFHVPTTFVYADGQIFAKLKRPGNGLMYVMHHFKTFDDIPGHWAQSEIELLASKYITYGRWPHLFDPNFLINRAQFTALLVRAMGLEHDPELAAAVYPDVDVDDWYAGAAGAAYRVGLITGSDGEFKSLRPITRREVVVALARAYAYVGKPVKVDNPEELVSQFLDGHTASWALQEMAQMIKVGVIRGDENKYLWSGENAKRSHVIVMLKRFMEDVDFIAE